MDTLNVPEVAKLPELGLNEESPVAFADMVLTSLFAHQAALLHAEYRKAEPSVTWFMRPLSIEGDGEDVAIAVSPSVGSFRSVLARFGHHYMGGQLYHGFATQLLQQRGQSHRCIIYTSNTGQSGFWIRVYGAVV